jgi:hypothetical protein
VSSITGSPVQYAGGGSGAGDQLYPSPACAGGGIGGARQAASILATSGFANTGGGGGGGEIDASANNLAGGAGGSGIVVIRYPAYLKQATSTTGSPTTYIAGPYRVYVFYASGTITF